MAIKKASAFTLATDLTAADLFVFADADGVLYRITKANFFANLRLSLLTPAAATFRVDPDGNQLQLWNATQEGWQSFWLEGAAGQERLVVGVVEA